MLFALNLSLQFPTVHWFNSGMDGCMSRFIRIEDQIVCFFSHLRASARTHTRLSVISHPIMPKEKRTIKMNVRRNRNKKKITTTTTHDKFFGESKTENISSSCLSITSIWSCIRKRRRKISSTRILKGYWKIQQQQNQKKMKKKCEALPKYNAIAKHSTLEQPKCNTWI